MPVIDVVKIIRPPRLLFIDGTTAWAEKKTAAQI